MTESNEGGSDTDQRAGSSVHLIHRTAYLKVDLFPCLNAFDRSALERAVSVQIPAAAELLRVASLEDILLATLRWFRVGGASSAVQQRDVRQLVALDRDALDLPYVRRRATALGVGDPLHRVLA